VYEVLELLDAPFHYGYWETAKEKNKTNPFGHYIRVINSLPRQRDKTWENSIFSPEDEESGKIPTITNVGDIANNYTPSDAVVEKWGYGYTPEEYFFFERKYDSLKTHYQQRTTMHTEAFLNYIRYQVKAELETAKGSVNAAKGWGSLAKEAAVSAKILPSQLTQADLSEGMDSFSQLVRSVEQAVDIVEILPKFKERPQDSVDFTIWCYVNYVRDLKGLPLAAYEEIYRFYDERKKEYETMSQEDSDEEDSS